MLKRIAETLGFKKKRKSSGPHIVPPGSHPIEPRDISRAASEVVIGLEEAGYKAYVVGGCVRDLLLGLKPKDFDVIMADNLFGDLVSDQIGMITGSLGMLPSATIPCAARAGERIKGGIYEPSHGSAPDISGKGIANPMATILSVAMMFEYAFARPDVARKIEDAVEETLRKGIYTPDLGGDAKSADVTAAVLSALGLTH